MKWILSLFVYLALAYSVEAGPFGIFGSRSCANGQCGMQVSSPAQVVTPQPAVASQASCGRTRIFQGRFVHRERFIFRGRLRGCQ